jgi:hypothetical protein
MALRQRYVDTGYYDNEDNWVSDGYYEEYDDGYYDYAEPEPEPAPVYDYGEPNPEYDFGGEGEITQPYVDNDGIMRNPDGSVYVENDAGIGQPPVGGGGGGGSAPNPPTTPTTPKPPTAPTVPKSILDIIKTGGELDYMKLLPLIGGIAGAMKSNNQTQPSGYQGTIPRYTATRQAPDAAGRLSGNVAFAPKMAKGGALESGGFVIPADVVSHLGNGSSAAGLRLLAQRYGASPIKGKGDGMSDSIKTTIDGRQPARVANEEARLTKSQVQAAGGAQKLYAMMEKIRQARTGSKEQGRQIDPRKYMPGGAVQSYVTGGETKLPSGTTGTESNLSNWAGQYVTDMLGKGQALSEMPYDQYKGPLTAGASTLQNKVSTGLQNTAFPGNLGGSFSSTTAPTIGAAGQPTGGGIASNYMNPYLSAVLNPQLAEMRRQAEINNQSSLGGLTKVGAFGGGRQAIMESEAGRNLLNAQNTAIGQGYSNAYDKGMQQFNVEQGQAKDLAGLMAQQGAVDRGITGKGIAADKAQFEEARLNPYKMVQFQQSLLSGLPLDARTYNQAPTDNFTQFSTAATTLDALLKKLGQTPTAPTTPKD